jgi:signal transduction histidine kinase
MKKMFITMVSHELKTPLATIMQYFEVLLRGIAGEVVPVQKEILQRMQIRTQGLLTLIRDWLNMAQIEKGKLSQKFEKLDMASIISETVDFMRQQAETQNIMLNIQVPGALPMIQGDKQTLNQVFINLIANAIQYNRNGGAVTVVAREESSNVEVEVSDTGIGISEKDLPFIFDDFYRVKAKETEGTGLGLSITKKIIEANSGTISVSSELGKGSAFVVSLPKIEK